MNFYYGYDKILKHEEDGEDIAFMTKHTNYLYNTMPFNLKNSGATFQIMVNKLFKEGITNIFRTATSKVCSTESCNTT